MDYAVNKVSPKIELDYADLGLFNKESPKIELDFFSNLPPEMIIDILSRLPVRTITRCKCVRKSWRDLLRTREFADSHLSKSASGIVITSGDPKYVEIYEFVDEIDPDRHELHYTPVTEFEGTDFINPYYYFGELQGSVNGLISLGPTYHSGLYVCNPVTREFMILPDYPKDDDIDSFDTLLTCGFGVSKSGQYKVVRVFHRCVRGLPTHDVVRLTKSVGHVYTLGTRKWRSIAHCAPFAKGICSVGAFLNGSLYWFVTDFQGYNVISCFDLEAEIFSLLLPPPLMRKDKCRGGLVSLGDCLCMFDSTSDDEVVIWSMIESGDKKFWTKNFVIRKSHKCYEIVYPIKIFKDGDMMFLYDLFVSYYSNKTKTSTRLDMLGVRDHIDGFEAMFHRFSFISLESCFPTEIVRPF